jgi:hypothetical protein
MHRRYLRSASPAKKAAAFLRLSRSSRSFRFSLRSWASGLADPVAKRLVGDAEVLGDLRDRLAGGLDQADRLSSELGRVGGLWAWHLDSFLGAQGSQRSSVHESGLGPLDEGVGRGYEIEPVAKAYNHPAGVGLKVRSQTYALEINELTDRVQLTDADLKRWQKDHRYHLGDPPTPPKTKPRANGRL